MRLTQLGRPFGKALLNCIDKAFTTSGSYAKSAAKTGSAGRSGYSFRFDSHYEVSSVKNNHESRKRHRAAIAATLEHRRQPVALAAHWRRSDQGD